MRNLGTSFVGFRLSGRGPVGAGVARNRRSLAGKVAAGILYAALALPPFLFGSREPTTLAAWCVLLGFGLIIAPVKRLERGHWLALGVLAFVVLCYGFVLHEQLSDHPWIAPFNPIWERASKALGEQLVPSASVVRGEALFALGHPLANVLAVALGIIVGVDSERARQGVRVMAWAGLGYAVYGILAYLFDPTDILWREKTAYLGNLTATFINRNTAACYFGSVSAVWLVLLLSAVRRNLPSGPIGWESVPERLLHGIPRDVLIRFVMLFLCLAAMFMTSSRGGVLVSLGVMILAFIIYFERDMPRGFGMLMPLAASILVGVLLLQLMGGSVSSRINSLGLSDAGRLSAYHSTLRIIADNPWFGTGLGTFAAAFPAYRSANISISGVWDIGHSTPLEFASEMGLPLTVVVSLAWAAAFVLLLRALRGRRATMAVPLSAMTVALIGLLHSSIDFSLQMAGYSIVVFALLGLGLSQAVRVFSSSSISGGISVNSKSAIKMAGPDRR